MKTLNSLTLALVLLAFCSSTLAGLHFASPLIDGRQFILRSCVATAELRKKIRNDRDTKPNVSEFIDDRHASPTSVIESRDKGMRVSEEAKIVNQREMHENQEGSQDQLVDHSRDSPLKTIEIRTINKRLPIFRKKNQLPLLEDEVSSKSPETSNNIILIKALS